MLSSEEFRSSLGFVVISTEPNIARLKDTARSIRSNFGSEARIVCSVAKAIKKEQLEEYKEVCPSFRGGNTVMSLINAGMKKAGVGGWRVFVMEGARLPGGLEQRYIKWIDGQKDILFPIVMTHDRDGRPSSILATFEDSTLNGMMIHSSLFEEVGEFSDNPICVSKKFWGLDAEEKGAKFKAILGVKIL
jgi:hypothetical protein